MSDKPNGVLLSWEQVEVALDCVDARINQCDNLIQRAHRDKDPVLMQVFTEKRSAAAALGRYLSQAWHDAHRKGGK